MTTKQEMQTIIDDQAAKIAELTSKVNGGPSVRATVLDAIGEMLWNDPRGDHNDHGHELHEYHNFGPMLLVSQMAFPVGKARFRAEQDYKQLQATKDKLASVMLPEEMDAVWSQRQEATLQRNRAAYDTTSQLEDQLLAVIRELECPKWDEDAHLERVEEYARADLDKRDAKRAAQATGQKVA